jgi:two-component system, LytTR family, sensor kinase
VCLCTAGVILIFYFLLMPPLLNRTPPLPIFQILLIFGLSWGYRLFLDRNLEEQRRKELDLENLKSELNFLRSQISPHFIFNVLNSMVALARKQPQSLEPVLIKLSELMRYMVYETSHSVPLSTEIDYLKGYIELQGIRFGDKLPVKFEVNCGQGFCEIEPMLLIPLVENAFKFGLGVPQPTIEIDITVSSTRQLIFQVKNRCHPAMPVTDKSESGIGLKNLQRRLNLLYPGNHTLSISSLDGWYIAKLAVTL